MQIRQQSDQIKKHNKQLFANVAATQEQKLLFGDALSNDPSHNHQISAQSINNVKSQES